MVTNELVIARLMKQGRYQELKDLLQQDKELSQSGDDFTVFMDQMIEQSGLSRSTIVQRAGLSKDYMYKVLRGDKKTTERDYIIAFCMAMDLSLPETQHALEIYPFQPLDSEDLRSRLIISAILGKTGIDELNLTLDNLGFPMLRTSPDMPAAKVGPARSTYGSLNTINSVSDEGELPKVRRRFKDMKKINTTVQAERAGCAPIDIAVSAEFELADDKGKTVFAHAYFGPEISFYAVDKVSLYDEKYFDETAQLEYYESLEEAGDSEYLMYFVELDKLTDEKYADAMKKVKDTKYGEHNFRIGMGFHGGDTIKYAEVYNDTMPERNEYLQIRVINGETTYSVSHASYFMQYELGVVYEAYFGKPEEQLYVVETNSLDELGEYAGYRPTFMQLEKILNQACAGWNAH